MIKAVIYDLDDTMVNSGPLHKRSWKKLLNEYGYKFSDIPEKIRSDFLGKKIIDNIQTVMNYFKLNESKNILFEKRIDIFLKLAEKDLQTMSGLLFSLKLFKKNNYKLAIATSGTKRYIDLVLRKFNIKKFFEVIVTEDDVKSGKPDPEPYLVTAKKLSLRPQECLVLEDAANGVKSAKTAGCACIAIRNKNSFVQDLSKADLVLDSLGELNLKIISQFN
jgi:beta-phosphoglucomutase-like phosphatase (HAD superfamily)